VTSRRIPISVFFPCHNEEENIESLVQKTLEVLPGISDDYEVIVVNDGSIDKTAAIVDSLANENSKVRLVNHPVNQGYGGALQSGFRAATKEWVFYTDGDGQFDITELPGLLDLVDQADIITCYRIERAEAGIRKLNSWAWSRLVNRLFKLNIRDVDCAFKLYKRKSRIHDDPKRRASLPPPGRDPKRRQPESHFPSVQRTFQVAQTDSVW